MLIDPKVLKIVTSAKPLLINENLPLGGNSTEMDHGSLN